MVLGSYHVSPLFILTTMSFVGDDSETNELDIDAHPDVRKAIDDATVAINSASVSISQGMYMEALTNGINMAESRRQGKDPSGPR